MDGLRLDMTLFIRHVTGNGDPGAELSDGWRLTQEINDMVHREFPGRITIAEDLQDSDWLTKTTGEGGAGFDLQWDARCVHPIRRLVFSPNDEDRSTAVLTAAATASYNGDLFQRIIYSESHDEVANGKARVTTEIDAANPDGWHAKKRSTLAAAMALTCPGVPMLFQGQEML
jgi:1,4-alpha-glucan branching enzyme